MKPLTQALSTVLLGFSLALTTIAGSAPSYALEKFTMRVDWVPYMLHAPFHLAVAKGWYEERGLDVTVDDGTGSSVTIQMVAAGAYDAGFAMHSAMAPGRDKGMPVKAIAGLVRKNDAGAIVPLDSGIDTVKDLEGKKVLTTAGGGDQPFLDAFFRNGGTSKEKINLTYVTAAAKVASYLAGQADAVITLVPFAAPRLPDQRPSKFLLFADHGLPSPSLGLISGEKTIKERPDAVRAFVEVSLRAWEYVLDGHADEAIDAITKARPGAKFDRVYMKQQLEAFRPFLYTENTKGKPFGFQPPADWAKAIETMIEAGVVKPGSRPKDFYTNEFIPSPKS